MFSISAIRRSTPSAVGERQMLPVQTNKTFIRRTLPVKDVPPDTGDALPLPRPLRVHVRRVVVGRALQLRRAAPVVVHVLRDLERSLPGLPGRAVEIPHGGPGEGVLL